MKKIHVLIIALLTIILTGCGKEQYLECSQTLEQSGMTINQNVVTKFTLIEATYIDMTLDIKVSDSYLQNASIDTLKDALKTQYDSQYGKKGITLNYTTDKNNIIIDIDFDLHNISDEDKKALNLTDVYGTITATKKAMEDQGYTCKIR